MQAPQQPKTLERIIVFSSRHVPASLVDQIADLKDFSVRFLNGYRNILQLSGQNEFQWGLVQNEDYCGQAYCYLLKQNAKNQELVKKSIPNGHIIKQTAGQMFIVQSNSNQTLIQSVLSVQQIKKLVEDVAQSKQTWKLAINLVKNAFSSFEAYQKSAREAVDKFQQQIDSQQQPVIPSVAETLTLEQNAKKLSGEMILLVPKCNRETGTWDDGQTLQIKLNTQ